MVVEFDVARVPARLSVNGHRDTSRPQWVRVIVYVELVWRHPITVAHLRANQFAGTRGMVTEVLYRE